jgi:hypothetical protein
MAFAKSGTRFRFAQGLDGMHRLGVHPMRTPSAGMSSLFRQDYPARCRRVGDNVYAVFRLRYPSQEKNSNNGGGASVPWCRVVGQ